MKPGSEPHELSDRQEHEPEASAHVNGRDMEVLRVIEEERLNSFTFEGLKRRVRAHSETLSRILDRLEQQEILEKAEEGYQVTRRGRDLAMVHPLNSAESRLTLLRTLLPPGVNLQQIFTDLKGRWFGTLRWLGHSSDDDDLVLKWITEDGGIEVEARFSSDSMTIDGKLLEGKDLADAIRASHQLVGHVAKLYSRPRMRQVAHFRVADPHMMPN